MSNLNTVDIIIIALLLIGGIRGAIKGFLEEFSEKFGFVIGFVSAVMFTKSLTNIVKKNVSLPNWATVGLTYVVLFLLGYLLIKIIASMISAVFNSDTMKFVDSFLGFVLAFCEIVIICGLLIQFLSYQNLIDLSMYLNHSLLNSKFISPITDSLLSFARGL